MNAYELTKVNMQKVKPSMAYKGGDYAAWKAEARAKLSSLLGLDTFKKVDPELDIEYTKKLEDSTEYRFTFQSEEGFRVPCHLLIPDGIQNPPLMICLQGHSPGMHISLGRFKNDHEQSYVTDGDRDFVVRALKEGYAAIALEQRSLGETAGQNGCLTASLANIMTGRTTIAERVWDVCRLIDVVESTFADKVDTSCISLMGNSGGGTATAYTAALEDRLVMAIPSCAMASYKDSIGAMPHCACNYVPNLANVFDMGDLMAMACPKYFVQVSGRDDDIFPLFAARQVFEDGKKAYADNGVEDRCELVVGQGGHRFYANDAWPVIHRLLGR